MTLIFNDIKELSVCVSESEGRRGREVYFFFLKKSLCLLKIDVEIFTVEIICCPGFASK